MTGYRDDYYGADSDGTGRDVRDHNAYQKEQAERDREAAESLVSQLHRAEKRYLRYLQPGPMVDKEKNLAEAKAEKERLEALIAAEEREAAKARRAKQDKEWTREVTAARKEEWNAVAKAHNWPQGRAEHEVGFKLNTIKRYLEKYNL